MAGLRPLAVERAARRDLRSLKEYGDSGLAHAYLALARELDSEPPARDAAALVAQMRLTLVALRELGGEEKDDDYTDELSARREARMLDTQADTRKGRT
jgi:hypothetical protein